MNRKEYNSAVNELSGRLYRYVLKCLKNSDDANDIVQDCFAKLWVNREKVEYKKVKSWLFTTAHNGLINLAKKNARTEILDTTLNHKEPQSRDESKSFETREIIELALSELSEQHKSIVLLRDLEGYNYQEIGEILELSESQVKVYLFRARKKIKDKIKQLS